MAGRISQSVSGLIGLGKEAYAHSQDKKRSAAIAENDHSQVDNLESDQDEDDWIADDAQDQLDHAKAETKQDSTEKVIEWFLKQHATPKELIPSGRLPAPVVVPQKRPKMRTRGFVRAYAPALEACGVDQSAFLDFIEGFHKETGKQGWFNATNIAVALSVLGYTAAVAPSAIVHFTAAAVHISIEAGRRAYITKKSNSYIDEINAHYFQPRGLYAMIMTYKPGSKNPSETLDFEFAAANAVNSRNSEDKSKMQDWKSSSGKMLDQQLPEVCPLVFPELESASEEQRENAFKRSLAFTRDYYDKRGKAEFAAKNPDSKLNVQTQEFASKHGDPTTFENSGLIGVLSGGKVDPRRRRWEKKNNRRERFGKEPTPSGGRSGVIVGEDSLVRKQLGDNILYLMVVNMPTEEELKAAKEAEEKMKNDTNVWDKMMSNSPKSNESIK